MIDIRKKFTKSDMLSLKTEKIIFLKAEGLRLRISNTPLNVLILLFYLPHSEILEL